jgi:hypothetical protein
LAKKIKSSQTDETPDVVETDVIIPEVVSEDTPETPEVKAFETPEDTVVVDEIQSEPEVEEPFVAREEPPIVPAPLAPEIHDSASNSVFLPAILGGLIAAGLGFAAAYYFIPRFEPAMVETMIINETAIAALREEVGAIDTGEGIAPLAEDLAALSINVTDQLLAIGERIASVEAQFVSIEERLVSLEKQPSADGTLQETALLAYQAELDNLRSQVEVQAGAAFAQLETTREEAAAIAETALLTARNAKARAALAQIRSSLDTGAPMTAALAEWAEVMGAPAPDALLSVAEGVPTLAKLQGDFPPAARQALSDSRSEGASGEVSSGFGSFLREQLNVRSVAPREGDDADAILSRAEAALREGQLETALTEVAALPEIAAAPLAGWVNQAQARADALTAANEISSSLKDN